jgi:hypothetical protein
VSLRTYVRRLVATLARELGVTREDALSILLSAELPRGLSYPVPSGNLELFCAQGPHAWLAARADAADSCDPDALALFLTSPTPELVGNPAADSDPTD